MLDLAAFYVQHPDRTLRPGRQAAAVEARPTRRSSTAPVSGFEVAGFEVALSVVLVLATILALPPLAACLYAGAVLRTGARVRLRDPQTGRRPPVAAADVAVPGHQAPARTAIQGAG